MFKHIHVYSVSYVGRFLIAVPPGIFLKAFLSTESSESRASHTSFIANTNVIAKLINVIAKIHQMRKTTLEIEQISFTIV